MQSRLTAAVLVGCGLIAGCGAGMHRSAIGYDRHRDYDYAARSAPGYYAPPSSPPGYYDTHTEYHPAPLPPPGYYRDHHDEHHDEHHDDHHDDHHED